VIIIFGIVSSFAVLAPHQVVRPDGTIVRVDDQSSIPQELRGLLERLKDWRILGVCSPTLRVSQSLPGHVM